MADKAPTISPLVAKLFALRADLETRLAEFEKKVDELIALGAGPYADEEGHTCTVVAAQAAKTGDPSYDLDDANLAKARELAGDDFRSLFDRKEVFTPCLGFELIAPKLLTPAKARNLVTLCTVPGKATNGKKAYLLWPKKQP